MDYYVTEASDVLSPAIALLGVDGPFVYLGEVRTASLFGGWLHAMAMHLIAIEA